MGNNMLLVLDSNVLLAEQGLKSTLGSVARLYIRRRGAELVLPEVIKLETEHNLRQSLLSHRATLLDSHRKFLSIFGRMRDLELPTEADIESRVLGFFDSLGLTLREIPFSQESARASFIKTVRKVQPSDKSQQFKDGVIWADCVKLCHESEVTLVTSDKAFFCDYDYSKGLAPNLAAEVSGAPFPLRLFPSLVALTKELTVSISVDINSIVRCHLAQFRDHISRILSAERYELTDEIDSNCKVFATENPDLLYVKYDVRISVVGLSPESNREGSFRFVGDCAYHLETKVIENIRIIRQSLTCKDDFGEPRSVNNEFLYGAGAIGVRMVSHEVRAEVDWTNG